MGALYDSAIRRSIELNVWICVDTEILTGLTGTVFPGRNLAIERYLQSLRPCSYDPGSGSIDWDKIVYEPGGDFLDWSNVYPTYKEYLAGKRIDTILTKRDILKNLIIARQKAGMEVPPGEVPPGEVPPVRKFILPVVLSAIAYFLFFA